ncbi:MAG: hypothetical protein H7A54_14900 [Akkermansiaceae bacterium]|nr:hypothetical protein [Akkermansiaceae bacterium]
MTVINHPGDFGSGFEACIAADSASYLRMDHNEGLTPATPNHALQRTGSGGHGTWRQTTTTLHPPAGAAPAPPAELVVDMAE